MATSKWTGTGRPDGVKRLTGLTCRSCGPSYGWADGCDDCRICETISEENKNAQQQALMDEYVELIEQGKTEQEAHDELGNKGAGTSGVKLK